MEEEGANEAIMAFFLFFFSFFAWVYWVWQMPREWPVASSRFISICSSQMAWEYAWIYFNLGRNQTAAFMKGSNKTGLVFSQEKYRGKIWSSAMLAEDNRPTPAYPRAGHWLWEAHDQRKDFEMNNFTCKGKKASSHIWLWDCEIRRTGTRF